VHGYLPPGRTAVKKPGRRSLGGVPSALKLRTGFRKQRAEGGKERRWEGERVGKTDDGWQRAEVRWQKS